MCRRSARLTALLAVLFLIASGCRPAQSGTLGAKVDDLVAAGLPGGTLIAAVVEDGQVSRFAAYGRDGSGAAPTPQTRYRIGSITKLFTATVVMQQRERGRLDLDAPITAALPEFKLRWPTARPITARDLLTHRSGLPTDHLYHFFSDTPRSMEEVTRALADEGPSAEPGTIYSYSNVGFSVLGHAAQAVGGAPYQDLVTRDVFGPCGMAQATWDWSAAIGSTVKGEASSEGGGLSVVPAGGAVMSVEDLAAFATGLMNGGQCANGRVLEEGSIAELWTPQDVGTLSGAIPQGLAFQVRAGLESTGGVRVVGHDGATLNFSSQLMMMPDLHKAVIVFSSEATAGDLVAGVARQLVREVLEAAVGSLPATPAAAAPDGTLPGAVLDGLAGVWATQLGVAELTRVGNGLEGTLQGQRLRFEPTRRNTFRVRPFVWFVVGAPLERLELSFDVLGGREVIQAVDLPTGAPFTIGERATPMDDLLGWDGAVGTWEPVESTSDPLHLVNAKVTTRAGLLRVLAEVATTTGPVKYDFVLLPRDADRAQIAGLGRTLGEWVWREGDTLRIAGVSLQKKSP